MEELNVDDQQYTLVREADLQEKIRNLESEMLVLLNKLVEEKHKLDVTIKEQNAPRIENFSEKSINLPQYQSENSLVRSHLSQVTDSRVVVEIDPNCKLHGHVYSQNQSVEKNVQPVLSSIFKINEQSSIDKLAAGDINNNTNNNLIYFKPNNSIDNKNNVHHLSYGENPIISNIDGYEHQNMDDRSQYSYEHHAPKTETYENIVNQNKMMNSEQNKNAEFLNRIIQTNQDNETESIKSSNYFGSFKTIPKSNMNKIVELRDCDEFLLHSEDLENIMKEVDGCSVEQPDVNSLLKILKKTGIPSNLEEKYDKLISELLKDFSSQT